MRLPFSNLEPGMLHVNSDILFKLKEKISATIENGEKIVLTLDFDDTIIFLNETCRQRKPVINQYVVAFLTDLIKEFSVEHFEWMILSSRKTDDFIKKNRSDFEHVLIETALPIFFEEVKKITGHTIDSQNVPVHCLPHDTIRNTHRNLEDIYYDIFFIKDSDKPCGYTRPYHKESRYEDDVSDEGMNIANKLSRENPGKKIEKETALFSEKAYFFADPTTDPNKLYLFVDDSERHHKALELPLFKHVCSVLVEPTPPTAALLSAIHTPLPQRDGTQLTFFHKMCNKTRSPLPRAKQNSNIVPPPAQEPPPDRSALEL